jgi:hypothetical protein
MSDNTRVDCRCGFWCAERNGLKRITWWSSLDSVFESGRWRLESGGGRRRGIGGWMQQEEGDWAVWEEQAIWEGRDRGGGSLKRSSIWFIGFGLFGLALNGWPQSPIFKSREDIFPSWLIHMLCIPWLAYLFIFQILLLCELPLGRWATFQILTSIGVLEVFP